jgi:hypothetical protein
MKIKALVVFLTIFSTSCNWWKEIWGDHSLGNNLSLLEGDKIEDRAVVFCSGRSAGPCHGGILVIPTYPRHFDGTGKYAEYVDMAKSNEGWVIVKTHQIKERKDNYWLINKSFNIGQADCAKVNCDSILQSYVTGPLEYSEFIRRKDSLKIDLSFE